VPDVVLGVDTLTTPESILARSLAGEMPVFRDVLTACALDARKDRTVTKETFEVTGPMRAEMRRRLRERGVRIADSVFSGGTRLLDAQLGYEIARYTFGPAAERRRRVREDSQIRRAMELVRGMSSPEALLGLAQGREPAH
jgi:hypothetical protein